MKNLLTGVNLWGESPLPGYGPVISVNHPVRTRMPGGVGAGGLIPPATRLDAHRRHCALYPSLGTGLESMQLALLSLFLSMHPVMAGGAERIQVPFDILASLRVMLDVVQLQVPRIRRIPLVVRPAA